jgi:thiol-disulfide isomerase/thioredoxin
VRDDDDVDGAGWSRRLAVAMLLATALATRPSVAEEPARPPKTCALLINGGGSASNNYLSHLHHLQDMAEALGRRGLLRQDIYVFSADGADSKDDLASRAPADPRAWLIEGTPVGRALTRTELSNTVWEGVTLRPAKKSELRQWFVGMSSQLRPGDTLLVFVTDHGTRNPEDPDNGLISLWNESLSVLEFRALLGHLRPGVRVIQVMSQCYSGAFADSMSPFYTPEPTGDVCGFYSTTRERPAFGCYPEGRDRDRFGHAFRFVGAMNRHAGLDLAHRDTLIEDTTPDAPFRTSDVYLEHALSTDATQAGGDLAKRIDGLLAQAFKDRARWEPEIRLLDRIGEVYGTFSPRSLAELGPRVEELQGLSKQLDTYGDRWHLALDSLRIDNLARFQEANPPWIERLQEARLNALKGEELKTTLNELLLALEPFSEGREDVWSRLTELRKDDSDAQTAKFRTDVRLAALLRMRTILIRIAGAQAVAGTERAKTLAALEACEHAPVGSWSGGVETPTPDLQATVVENLPPLDRDLETVRQVLPSWLGIQFGPVPEGLRKRFNLERGAAAVRQVYDDSPAKAAGIAAGDILLGPPGHTFSEPNEIREWIMRAPRDAQVKLRGLHGEEGTEVEFELKLASFPDALPAPPAPPKEGDHAPALEGLEVVRGPAVPDGRHVLFFWATWCGPCKASLPELMEWSEKTGVPVLAISDEEPEVQRKFLEGWTGPFPERVAADGLRRTHLSFGISGTPTFVWIDAEGTIERRQTGYGKNKGLSIPDWKR